MQRSKAGRKPKSDLLQIQSLAWAFAVEDMNDPRDRGQYILPKYFLNKYIPNDDKFLTNTFKKMKCEVRTPSNKKLEYVDNLLKNSRRYFDSGLWELASIKNLGQIPLKEAFNRLDGAIVNDWGEANSSDKTFWRNLKKPIEKGEQKKVLYLLNYLT